MDWLALAKSFHERVIVDENREPYLTRYCIWGWHPGLEEKFPFSVYLHRIHQPDADEALHNHPWEWAVSVVLRGGYLEELPTGERVPRNEGSIRVLRSSDYHRIAEVQPDTWTLFLVGPKVSSWGFQVPGRGHVPWRDRLRERGIDPDENGGDT